MAKGKLLNDGAEWSAYPGVKDGATLVLMGTAQIEHAILDVKKLKGKARRNAEEKFEEKKEALNPPTAKKEEIKDVEFTTRFQSEVSTYTIDGIDTYDKFCDGT